MAEPEGVLEKIERFFLSRNDFAGMKVLITAGPTYEAIDPVRFVGNHSSGKMGIALAEELSARGAEVVLVLGPSNQTINCRLSKLIRVKSAEDMYNACMEEFSSCTIAIMSAAVADYTPVAAAEQKLKKTESSFQIELKRTKDILGSLGAEKKSKQWLVGFALETNNEKEYAVGKMKAKNADMIVLNSLNDEGAGFGADTNKITIFDKKENEYSFSLKSKAEVATDIIETLKKVMND